ncbi:hypothetical protein [Bacillus sp. NEB1478]|uniref:hypothetical protein n=1 Tax=Bacillus sp. NEB1478 TaxID=3073816 RepID=UPI002873EC63|nr:hypothetical protein [Bacillus sp. NEB1478]WNB93027.1 hypothetical protein RGB74_04965 [Bacillus sp. NEB1478]
MKKRNRVVLFALSSVLAIGVYTFNDYKDKANATENTKHHINTDQIIDKAKSKYEPLPAAEKQVAAAEKIETVKQSPSISQTEKSQTVTDRSPSKQVNKQPVKEITEVTKQENQNSIISEEGYTYVNLMKMENLSNLINIAKKHSALLYGMENSDCFAMFSKDHMEQPIIMFSTGSRSVPIEHVSILYDMHPAIKDQIKQVVDTGKEMTVEVGEYESYFISKEDGEIKLSY